MYYLANSNIVERYEYATDIITSWDGHEQRIKTRNLPRHFLSYEYTALDSYQAQWLRGVARMRQNTTMYVPMWHNCSYLSEDFVAHGKALYIEKNCMFNFFECDWLEVFSHDDVMQTDNTVRKIFRFSDGMITLQQKIDCDLLKANTHIFPLRKMAIRPTNDINYVYSNGTNLSLSFEDLCIPTTISIPYTYIVEFEKAEGFNLFNLPSTYNNKDVFPIQPQWVDDTSNVLNIGKNTNRLDNSTGVFVYDLKNSCSYDIHSLSLILMNKESINNVVRFFKRTCGRYLSFYAPSWVNDFELDRDIRQGTNFLYTKFNHMYKYYLGKNRKKSIVIFTKDRKSYIYDIMSYSYETINNIKYGKITVSEPFSRGFARSDVLMVSYLNLVRFDHDELELSYESDIVANVNLVLKEVDDDI